MNLELITYMSMKYEWVTEIKMMLFCSTFYVRGIMKAGIILCLHPANERRRYIVTSSLFGWAHTQNDESDVLYKGHHAL